MRLESITFTLNKRHTNTTGLPRVEMVENLISDDMVDTEF
jgi:hypothetical protein